MSGDPIGDYLRVSVPEPHALRGRRLLDAHPELRRLAAPAPQSAAWTAILVAVQIAVAVRLGPTRWFVWLPCAYVVGATIDHALWVLIHECAHNLVFRFRPADRLVAIAANLPLVVPAAISFGHYHLIHHRHMGELGFDADLPGPVESAVVGRRSVPKAIWMGSIAFVQGALRPLRLRRMRGLVCVDGWTMANAAVQIVAMAALVAWMGTAPLKYLVASTIFAVGLHPLGARWIQEHFVFAPGQETYSYYGPLNRLCFNVGYHNEHHDLVTVPWVHLPTIRAAAPEFYDTLYAHASWSGLMRRFLLDRSVTLRSRIVRPDAAARTLHEG